LIDIATGSLIDEGPWVTNVEDVEVPLPGQDGMYRVLVSGVSEDKGWAYSRGSKIRVIDVRVEKGAMSVVRDSMTTLRALQWQGLPRRFAAFLLEPWIAMWKHRGLIAAMVERDFQGRYRGSMADRLWSIGHPLLLMLTYWFVFGVVLKTRFGKNPDPAIYVLFFLGGMLPWLAFSEAVGRAPNVILESRNLVKKLVFPVEILPINLVASGLITGALAIIVYLFFLMATREYIPAAVLWLPLILIPQLLLTAGICWAWAGIGVFARDLGQINGFLLTLTFFLTPICYPMDMLPLEATQILQKSPVFKLVGEYRLLFVTGAPPDWPVLLQLALHSLAIFYIGYGIFRRLRRSFVDVL
jgi:lipopolysaccharide transport system permease protein